MKLDSICVCGTKPSVNDKLLKCHSLDGNINNDLMHPTGTMKGTDSSRANANAGCSMPHSPTGSNDNIGNCASDDDIEITKLAEGETNKHASLGNLSDNHFDTILSPTG